MTSTKHKESMRAILGEYTVPENIYVYPAEGHLKFWGGGGFHFKAQVFQG